MQPAARVASPTVEDFESALIGIEELEELEQDGVLSNTVVLELSRLRGQVTCLLQEVDILRCEVADLRREEARSARLRFRLQRGLEDTPPGTRVDRFPHFLGMPAVGENAFVEFIVERRKKVRARPQVPRPRAVQRLTVHMRQVELTLELHDERGGLVRYGPSSEQTASVRLVRQHTLEEVEVRRLALRACAPAADAAR